MNSVWISVMNIKGNTLSPQNTLRAEKLPFKFTHAKSKDGKVQLIQIHYGVLPIRPQVIQKMLGLSAASKLIYCGPVGGPENT